MGTHVRVNVDGTAGEVVVPCPVKLTKWRDGGPCVEYYQDNKRREYHITPAEYDRLAALLTGEGEAAVTTEADVEWLGEVAEGVYRNTESWAAAVKAVLVKACMGEKRPAPKCIACKDTGMKCTGGRGAQLRYAPCECRDPRTPGQVAYEAYWSTYGNDGDDLPTWSEVGGKGRGSWEKAAAAVLAHGRAK